MASEPEAPSLPWPARLMSELDVSDGRARDLAKGLGHEQLNWRLTPEAWSIGQCLDHLLVFNELYLPAMSSALAGHPRSGVREITPGWFGGWFLRTFVEPSMKTKRVQAPKKIAPSQQIETNILERFLRSNQQAREVVCKASEFHVNRIRFKNPLIPLIRFTVGTGLEIVCKHQARHLLQAERVKQSAEFPRQSLAS